jgi:yecA family protein
VVLGPELIMPSEWLPVIWGGQKPKFETEDEMRTVLRTIMGRYNEIAAYVNANPDEFEAIFWEDRKARSLRRIGQVASSMRLRCAQRHGSR